MQVTLSNVVHRTVAPMPCLQTVSELCVAAEEKA